MQHSILLLMVIVLSLAAQICRSMTSKEITYTRKDVSDPRVFRCNCLLKALTHMRLSRMSFRLTKEPVDLILGIVVDSNDNEALSILYNSDGVKIGSLWPFHLYTGLLRSYYIGDVNNEYGQGRSYNAGTDRSIFGIHNYVIELMLSDFNNTGCGFYGLNDWYPIWFEQNRLAELPQIKEKVRKNNREFVSLVETKKELMNANEKRMIEELSESLMMKNLLLNELGHKMMIRRALMNSYNVEVDWDGSHEMLKSSWELAIKVSWTYDHLQNLKLYFTKHFGLLKIIFFRITLAHLLNIEVLERISMQHSIHYAQKWPELLRNFGKMLHIDDDPDIVHLLKLFDMLGNPGRNNIYTILHKCSLPMNCNATVPMVLNQTKVEKDFRDAIMAEGELITQIVAKKFMTDLGKIFKGVNFGVVRSLIEYIDEVDKMVKRKLEEPTSSQIDEMIRSAYIADSSSANC